MGEGEMGEGRRDEVGVKRRGRGMGGRGSEEGR